MKHRFVIFSIALIGVTALLGCNRFERVRISAKKDSRTKQATGRLRFGPVYSVFKVEDPVVAKTLEHVKKDGAPITGAEIRGYLVDWVIRQGRSTTVRELAVMKDGSLFTLGVRPAAGFGEFSKARLTPEPVGEANARKYALNIAHRTVAKLNPEFATIKPEVYNYLVRIHRLDGSKTDVWVDPDVHPGRFFYNVKL